MKKIISAFLILFFTLTSAKAEDTKISFYNINDIIITASGDNQSTMRDNAITEGQRRAMWELQNKMKSKGYIVETRKISDEQINQAIQAIEVRDEKIYTKSYRAKLNVQFSPKIISRIFNIGFIEPSVAPDKFLTIPILSDEEGTKIWRHKWWDILQTKKSNYMILPIGDLEDVRNFTKEDYSVRDFRNLLKSQEKYNASAILIATAEYIATEKAVNLVLEKIKNGESETYNFTISGKNDENQTELLAKSANELVKRINLNDFTSQFHADDEEETAPSVDQESTNKKLYQKNTPRTEKTLNPPVTTQEESVEIPANMENKKLTDPKNTSPEDDITNEDEAEKAVPLFADDAQVTDAYVFADDLVSWGRIRAKLTKTNKIKNIRIKSFTAGKAYITLEHDGDFIDLMTILNNDSLLVGKGEKLWEIREKKSK